MWENLVQRSPIGARWPASLVTSRRIAGAISRCPSNGGQVHHAASAVEAPDRIGPRDRWVPVQSGSQIEMGEILPFAASGSARLARGSAP